MEIFKDIGAIIGGFIKFFGFVFVIWFGFYFVSGYIWDAAHARADLLTLGTLMAIGWIFFLYWFLVVVLRDKI